MGPAVTIHAYSPPLVRMGSYLVEPSGQLLRLRVSYEDELRLLPPQHKEGLSPFMFAAPPAW